MAKKKETTEAPAPETTPAVADRPDAPSADTGLAPAEYTVVARRYRPQQFAELIGQEAVSRAITNAITSTNALTRHCHAALSPSAVTQHCHPALPPSTATQQCHPAPP